MLGPKGRAMSAPDSTLAAPARLLSFAVAPVSLAADAAPLVIVHISDSHVPPSPRPHVHNSDSPAPARPLLVDVYRNASGIITSFSNESPIQPDVVSTLCPPPRLKSPRGEVVGFSRKSRTRMLAKMSTVRRDAPFCFVTLTYPGKPENWDASQDWPDLPGPRQAKHELSTLIQWVHDQYPSVGVIWKLEPQERGVPHFHLVMYGLDRLGDAVSQMLACSLIRQRWHAMVGRGQLSHFVRGVNFGNSKAACGSDFPFIETSPDLSRWYMSKYMTKTGEPLPLNPDSGLFLGLAPGRFWGVMYPGSVPFDSPVQILINDPQATSCFLRIQRGLAKAAYRTRYAQRCRFAAAHGKSSPKWRYHRHIRMRCRVYRDPLTIFEQIFSFLVTRFGHASVDVVSIPSVFTL